MKGILFITTMLIACNSFAQKGIDGLIKAETNFAALSMSSGSIKEAFLANMDTNSLVFDNGKAVNGIRLWSTRERGKSALDWHPQYAEIAASNDFGYTTGPWTFRLSPSDSVIAKGFYSTLWYYNKEGKWAFLVDLGIDDTPGDNGAGVTKITVKKSSVRVADTAAFVNEERDFIKLFNEDSAAAYKKYLSVNSILNRNGHLPATTTTGQASLIAATSSSVQYMIDGWIISPSRDMACVYGNTSLKDKKDNYMRIWRHEKDGWKIALEVLHH